VFLSRIKTINLGPNFDGARQKVKEIFERIAPHPLIGAFIIERLLLNTQVMQIDEKNIGLINYLKDKIIHNFYISTLNRWSSEDKARKPDYLYNLRSYLEKKGVPIVERLKNLGEKDWNNTCHICSKPVEVTTNQCEEGHLVLRSLKTRAILFDQCIKRCSNCGELCEDLEDEDIIELDQPYESKQPKCIKLVLKRGICPLCLNVLE
jgi:hypothetical protein